MLDDSQPYPRAHELRQAINTPATAPEDLLVKLDIALAALRQDDPEASSSDLKSDLLALVLGMNRDLVAMMPTKRPEAR